MQRASGQDAVGAARFVLPDLEIEVARNAAVAWEVGPNLPRDAHRFLKATGFGVRRRQGCGAPRVRVAATDRELGQFESSRSIAQVFIVGGGLVPGQRGAESRVGGLGGVCFLQYLERFSLSPARGQEVGPIAKDLGVRGILVPGAIRLGPGDSLLLAAQVVQQGG